MPLAPHSRLGPYEILAPLGAGGMGEVYRARDTRLDRTVAIKILPERLAAREDLRQRFEREARAVAALNHPHICQLHDIGHENGIHFLVMEYLEGETLAARLAKGPLPLADALRRTVEVADALDQAHRHDVVHRDLKPGNVMLTKAGAKLLDFGLAKLRPHPVSGSSETLTQPAPLTSEGAIVGTLQYMAPEQLEGKDADSRSDIFAFGAVLYEMLTGRKAFEGKSQASIISAIMTSDPPPVASLQPLSPPALDHIVKRCLAKDPDTRWQNMADIAEDLRYISETAAPAPTKPAKRNLLPWALAALFLLTAASFAFLYFRGGKPPAQLVRFSIPPPAAGFGSNSTAVLSPDGEYIAFTVPTDERGPVIWVRPLRSSAARPLLETAGAWSPFWSPDSRQIGYFAGGAKLMKIDISGGSPQAVCDVDGLGIAGTWSRDGVILFSQLALAPIWQVPASGGRAKPATTLAPPRESSHLFPHFLPDQRRFIYLAQGAQPEDSALFAASLDSKEVRRLVSLNSPAVYSPSGHLLFLRGQSLFAQPFDAKRLQFAGDPVRVAEQVQLFRTAATGGAFSISANGILCYIEGSVPPTRFTWFDRSGRRLGTIAEPAGYTNPALSPDEKRLAAGRVDPQISSRDVWVFDLARGTQTRLTFDRADDFNPLWSPDGSRIAFISARKRARDIYWKNSDGTGDEELLFESGEHKSIEDWSRDGRLFIFNVTVKGLFADSDLWALPATPGIPAADRKPFPVIQDPQGQDHSQLSPDGRWIAYRSSESGTSQIFVQSFPPSGGKWQISTTGGSEPRWRGDGKELFYVEGTKLMAVDVTAAGRSFQASAPKALFEAPLVPQILRHRYVVTRDGQRFLLLTTAGTAQSSIAVVLNWPALFR